MENRAIYFWFTLILLWYLHRTYGCNEMTDSRHVRCVGQVTPPGFQVRLPTCLTPCDVPNGLKTTTRTCNFEDVDECVLKVDDCGVNSYCVNTVGSYSCQCLPGYARHDSICVDVNECRAGLHNCSINELCTNNEGSYFCECMLGFTRDGQECVDIDECYHGTYNCSRFSYCVNDAGSYTCECMPGYSRKGHEEYCTDVNECHTGNLHNCSDTELCVNTNGSFECVCMLGYHLNGDECVDIDECVQETHSCSTSSYCVNTNGSYFCKCAVIGYYWDGSDCVDVDECGANLHDCSPGMVCTNTQGSYVCECDADHSWVEHQCVANPYRSDLRCGGDFIAPNGEVAICNKDSDYYCCSYSYWCGYSDGHCSCSECTNYREL